MEFQKIANEIFTAAKGAKIKCTLFIATKTLVYLLIQLKSRYTIKTGY